MTTPTLRLRIAGMAEPGVSRPSGWETFAYRIDGKARATGAESATADLLADDVLELELADGTRLLVAADEASRYLGSAARGTGAVAEIAVGAGLRPGGVRPPAGLARDGLGAWVLKALRVHRKGATGMAALAAAGRFQDAQLEDRNGLYRCNPADFSLAAVDAMEATAEPCLLFIHGTASSTAGSFAGLWQDAARRQRLIEAYGNRILAFEHRSLTESPVVNALALVKALPAGARLHVVSHSRGGMVGELLALAQREGDQPIPEAEIARFAAVAKKQGAGAEADVALLRELDRELATRRIVVERFVRVACPVRGTTLLAGRLDRWASVMLNLLGMGVNALATPAVGKAYGLAKEFLLGVVAERRDADLLPGLAAMRPDSPLVALLNPARGTLAGKLHVVAGDFEGSGLLAWLGDCLSEMFYDGETDLVVNTPSMSGGLARGEGIWLKPVAGPEVHHLSYFKRAESAKAMLAALGGDDAGYQQLPGPSRVAIARGGKVTKTNPDAPIALLLPGIMGSHIQLGDNHIWFDLISIGIGRMAELKVDAGGQGPAGAVADGWLDMYYENLSRHLWTSHELRPFSYDWRLSMLDAATQFGAQLDQAMADAEQRGKPLRIVAHSMGGLVARLALASRWDRFKAIPGSRFLQLGTPNNGSHSIAGVLLGRDDFVQTIERIDLRHNMEKFLAIVSDFPGVLQLLPWPGANGLASDGVDYFDHATWTAWHQADGEENRKRWNPPRAAALQAARAAVAAIQVAPVDPACTLYVAGCGATPVAVRRGAAGIEIGCVPQGDGRVPWSTGIPPGVPTWYAEAAHGDLPAHELAFDAYVELLRTGNTRDPALTREPRAAQESPAPVFRTRGTEGNGLYPSEEEVLAAAMGGSRRGRRRARKAARPVHVEVIHGSPATADTLVLIGAYGNDSLRGSAAFIDGHLNGQLTQARALGRYPGQPGEAAIFRNPNRNARPAGAVVVGLGALGELSPGELTDTLCAGLLEHARNRQHCGELELDGDGLLIAALLVGTGFGGLTVETGAACLAEALRRANLALEKAGVKAPIARLALYEESRDRAIAILQALRALAGQARLADAIRIDGMLRSGEGGYAGRSVAAGGDPGSYRVVITGDPGGGLRFTVIGDRARNQVYAEPSQRRAVDALIASMTGSTSDHPGLSRALFELMVPNALKQAVGEARTLMLSVDAEAARYPWELMRDLGDHACDGDGSRGEIVIEPLAIRVEAVRQLGSTFGASHVPLVANRRGFIVGDTDSGYDELPGAQDEAEAVAAIFRRQGMPAPSLLLKAGTADIYQALFDDCYQFMHFATHGVVAVDDKGDTGIVLGKDSVLTSAQIKQLRHVPEFVFLNCCHLGSMEADAQARWGALAAGLATQLIEMGCKAVIAAGWMVDDAAAATFARSFYEAMFAGERFGLAVLKARKATWEGHRLSNTWGAYQAYGDERYRFPVPAGDARSGTEYVHPSHVLADVGIIRARLKGSSARDRDGYVKWLDAIEQAAANPALDQAAVREALGLARGDLGDRPAAIRHLRAALAMEDAGISLKALEQLANYEVRHGATLADAAGDAFLEAGKKRIEDLIAMAPTSERLALLGSYWKRMAQRAGRQGANARVGKCIQEMLDAYRKAAKLGYRRDGLWDYYPLLNWLDAAFLVAARKGDPGIGDAEVTTLVTAAVESAQRRFAGERNFFHAVAGIDAERILAQWAALAPGKPAAAITQQDVRDKLVARYRELRGRMGAPGEHDSTVRQLDDVAGLLPDNPKGRAVGAALRGIAGALA